MICVLSEGGLDQILLQFTFLIFTMVFVCFPSRKLNLSNSNHFTCIQFTFKFCLIRQVLSPVLLVWPRHLPISLHISCEGDQLILGQTVCSESFLILKLITSYHL